MSERRGRERGASRERDPRHDDRKRHRHSTHKTRSSEPKASSSSRKPSRSLTIAEVRAERHRQRAKRRRKNPSDITHKTKFDMLPDPNAPKTGIELSLEKAKETSAHTGVAASSVLSSSLAAPKHSRSIYVGGIPAQYANEKDLYEFFTHVIDKVTGKSLNAVQSVYVNKAKGFGFVEVNDYNLATALIKKLNGVTFKSSALQLKRPTNYDAKKAPPEGVLPEIDVTKIGMKPGKPSGHVENVPEKIYIAGIPTSVTDDQLQELLEAFGQLEAMTLVKDRGYAFCLYRDRSVTESAIAGLNGLTLGSQMLTVKKAELNLRPENSQLNLTDVNIVSKMLPSSGGLDAFGFDSSGKTNSSGVQGLITSGNQPSYLPGVPDAFKPTRILVLQNMLNEDELVDPKEYEEIFEDIQAECSKYGKVISLQIPKPSSDGSLVAGLGKAFIEFEKELESVNAKQKLDGRTFGENKVECSFLSEEKYSLRKF